MFKKLILIIVLFTGVTFGQNPLMLLFASAAASFDSTFIYQVTDSLATDIAEILDGTTPFSGDITLENEEIISNGTDGDVKVTFNEDAVNWGDFHVASSLAGADVEVGNTMGLIFQGNDDAENVTDYARIELYVADETHPSEDSWIRFWNTVSGTLTNVFSITGTSYGGSATSATLDDLLSYGKSTFNENGLDEDFRIETDGEDSAFVVDGTDGDIYMEGLGTGTGTQLSRLANTDEIVEESSSMRFKDDIEDWYVSVRDVMKLKPRQWVWNEESSMPPNFHDYGMVAEEVYEVIPEAVTYNDKGQIQSWDAKTLATYLVGVVQDQQKQINALEERVTALEK